MAAPWWNDPVPRSDPQMSSTHATGEYTEERLKDRVIAWIEQRGGSCPVFDHRLAGKLKLKKYGITSVKLFKQFLARYPQTFLVAGDTVALLTQVRLVTTVPTEWCSACTLEFCMAHGIHAGHPRCTRCQRAGALRLLLPHLQQKLQQPSPACRACAVWGAQGSRKHSRTACAATICRPPPALHHVPHDLQQRAAVHGAHVVSTPPYQPGCQEPA